MLAKSIGWWRILVCGAGASTRLMAAVEDRLVEAESYELFTGHLSEGNLRLYHRLGYQDFREEGVSLRPRMVYLRKPGEKNTL